MLTSRSERDVSIPLNLAALEYDASGQPLKHTKTSKSTQPNQAQFQTRNHRFGTSIGTFQILQTGLSGLYLQIMS